MFDLYHWVLALCSFQRTIPRASNDNGKLWTWRADSQTFFCLTLADDSHLGDHYGKH